ncbi:MAG: sigma-70 family RNA polymerase sigma factor [Spirochaetales bacterium]|jgi:RNA polymerase sigma factor (sigma-70 family)|nr:sigma-70 family RNA polymerase sigma factor [Spirochaetales bacterium]
MYYSREEERDCFQTLQSIRSTDSERNKEAWIKARDIIVRNTMPLVKYLADHYGKDPEQKEDLMQIGNETLLKAMMGFDLSKNTRFWTFVGKAIARAIVTAKGRDSLRVRYSERIRKLSGQVAKVNDELMQKYNREPTSEEIAKAINGKLGGSVTPEDIDETLNCIITSDVYSDPISSEPGPEDQFIIEQDIQEMYQTIDILPPRRAAALRMRELEEKSYAEIGIALGCTEDAAKSLRYHAIHQLREAYMSICEE